MLWTIITFVFFTILVAVISYVKTKGDDQTSAEGYFLAGRGLPGFVIAGSLLLTNISAEQLVGTNGQTWASNMSGMAFEVVAAIACILLALYAAPKYLKSGVATVPQMIGIRYDRTTKLWFSIAYIALYLIVQIPLILYAGALVLENIFGISVMFGITKLQAVIAVCIATSIIGSIYAICGGLKAVAVSDTVNGALLIIGGFAIPFVALHVLGQATGSEGFAMIDGFKFLVENYPQKLNSISPANAMPPEVPWPTVFTGLAFLCIQSWCTHQSFIQRVLAAKDLKEAQKGALYCAFMKILGFLYLALPGVIAYALFEVQGTQ
ncbi:MAG: solute:sodium symporter family transporter, partial [Butyricicoccus sp.]|nr:solute:sodium symporter family transporter [Butyricicoccus sp.]